MTCGSRRRSGAVWETFVFAQLRHRERRAGRTGSLFFWRDRTREVDFVVDAGGRLHLYEAKWTEFPAAADAVNLAFVTQGRRHRNRLGRLHRLPNARGVSTGRRLPRDAARRSSLVSRPI